MFVDHDSRRIDAVINAHRRIDILSHHRRLERDRKRIRLGDGSIEIVVGIDADHGPEDLHGRYIGIGRRIEQDGRLITAVGQPLAAGKAFRAAGDRRLQRLGRRARDASHLAQRAGAA